MKAIWHWFLHRIGMNHVTIHTDIVGDKYITYSRCATCCKSDYRDRNWESMQ